MTNSVKFFKNVTVNFTETSRRKGGYFSYNEVEHTANLATLTNGRWIEFNGYRKDITAKNFGSFTGKEIKEVTYRKWVRHFAKLAKIEAEKRAEQKRLAEIEAEKKSEELRQFQADLLSELPTRVLQVADRIKETVTAEQIEARLNKDMTTNEVCNRAVGIVGYEFAKHLGWMKVLRTINEIVYG